MATSGYVIHEDDDLIILDVRTMPVEQFVTGEATPAKSGGFNVPVKFQVSPGVLKKPVLGFTGIPDPEDPTNEEKVRDHFFPFGAWPQKDFNDDTVVKGYRLNISLDYDKDRTDLDRWSRLKDEYGAGMRRLDERMMVLAQQNCLQWRQGELTMEEVRGKDDMGSKGKYKRMVRWPGKRDQMTKLHIFNDQYGPTIETRIGHKTVTARDPSTGETYEHDVMECELYDQDNNLIEPWNSDNLQNEDRVPKLSRGKLFVEFGSLHSGEQGIVPRLFTSQIQLAPRKSGRLGGRSYFPGSKTAATNAAAAEVPVGGGTEGGAAASGGGGSIGAGAPPAPAPMAPAPTPMAPAPMAPAMGFAPPPAAPAMGFAPPPPMGFAPPPPQ